VWIKSRYSSSLTTAILAIFLILLDHEADIAPVAFALPAVKIFENEQRADLAARRLASSAIACTWLTSGLPEAPLICALTIGPGESRIVNAILPP
jgi:hypothetical protein